jgi:hypothetical protein
MKSLEIVNERIESTLKAEDKLKMELQLCFYKDEAQQIKQDLEVLEIIRKKKVDALGLLYEIRQWEEYGDEHILKSYNGRYNNKLYELTLEELLKLKQWLEGNE